MDHEQLKFSTKASENIIAQNMRRFTVTFRFQADVRLEDRKVTSGCLVAQFCKFIFRDYRPIYIMLFVRCKLQ